MSKKLALLCDVDMTLAESMSTEVSRERKALAEKMYNRLEGAFALVTGRTGASVDMTFPFRAPASVEHHAAWRQHKGENFISIAPPLDTKQLIDFARKEIVGKLRIFDDQKEIHGEHSGVFIERKEHSIALVFNLSATPAAGRHLLDKVIKAAIDEFDLDHTHRKAVNTDSIELVHKGNGKREAVRYFMASAAFKGRKPVFIGDSGSDAKAMKVCKEEYGGYGIAVGPTIPDADYIHKRVDGIDGAWAALKRLTRTR